MMIREIGKPSYTLSDLRHMKLRGKPRCPYCEKPVSFIYDDMPQGHFSQFCPNCGRQVFVDVRSLTAHKVASAEG